MSMLSEAIKHKTTQVFASNKSNYHKDLITIFNNASEEITWLVYNDQFLNKIIDIDLKNAICDFLNSNKKLNLFIFERSKGEFENFIKEIALSQKYDYNLKVSELLERPEDKEGNDFEFIQFDNIGYRYTGYLTEATVNYNEITIICANDQVFAKMLKEKVIGKKK